MMKNVIKSVSKRLFEEIDIASIVLFRFVIGIIFLSDLLGYLIDNHIYKAYVNPDFLFTYYGFQFLEALPAAGMLALLILLCLCSIFISIGFLYRLSSTILALGFTYLFLLEKSYYLNHGYLLCILSFLLIIIPAHRAYSIDAYLRPSIRKLTIPFWTLFLIRFEMGVVYFWGGIAKINPDWLNAKPLDIWLAGKSQLNFLKPYIDIEHLAWIMSYTGLFFDLFIVFFLLYHRTRLFAFIFACSFHLVNLFIFSIGVFPALSLLITSLFFKPNFPRKLVHWLSHVFKLNIPLVHAFSKKKNSSYPTLSLNNKQYIWVFIIAAFCLFNCYLPLRHWLFKGNVNWTEEGHRFSWRMMLRGKKAVGRFYVEDKTGKRTKVDLNKYLTKRQQRKMMTHPDMILQFAHHLAEDYLTNKEKEVAVYTYIRAGLNGRPLQLYIDSSRNLAAEPYQFWQSADWIIPLKE